MPLCWMILIKRLTQKSKTGVGADVELTQTADFPDQSVVIRALTTDFFRQNKLIDLDGATKQKQFIAFQDELRRNSIIQSSL